MDASQRQRQGVLAITAVAVFLAFLDLTIVNVAFPDIARSFPGTDFAELSWVLNAYNVVFAALLIPAGRLADRLGRKRVFLIGLALFTGSSVLCGSAPSAATLIAFRAIQAGAAALMVPASLALLLAAYPEERRASAVSLYGAAAGIASAVGPSLGGLLVTSSSWRLVFFVNFPLGAGALIAGWRLLGESREPAPTARPDLFGAALLASAVGALALALVKGEEWAWGSGRTGAAFAASLILGLLFVGRSRRHPEPLVESDLLRIRSLAVANIGTLLFATAFYGVILCNVLFLTAVWGYSVLEAALAISPAPLAAAITALPAGRLADRVGERVIVLPGLILFILGVTWLVALVGSRPDFVGEWLPGVLIYGAGIGLAFPALAAAAVADAPAARFATASALNATFRQLGAVLGVALIIATVSDAGHLAAPYRDGWSLMLALAGCSFAAALGIPSRRATP